MEKIGNKLIEMFSTFLPKQFYTIGDKIVEWVGEQDDLQMVIVVLEFSMILTKYRVSGDIIFKKNGISHKIENYIDDLIDEDSFPKYVLDGVDNGYIGMIKFSSDDIENLYEETTIPLYETITWDSLIRQNKDVGGMTLIDRGFYTLVKTDDSLFRYGIIEKLPSKLAYEIYPFKSTKIEI